MSDLVAALFTHLSFELIDLGRQIRERIDELTERVEKPGTAIHYADLHDVDRLFHGLDGRLERLRDTYNAQLQER